MKVFWIIHFVPQEVAPMFGAATVTSGGWISGMRDRVTKESAVELTCVFKSGLVSLCSGVCKEAGYRYIGIPQKHFSDSLGAILKTEMPDVIHIWGTEFATALETVRAAENAGLQDRVVVSLQGVISEIAGYVRTGLPFCAVRGITPYELIRKCSVSASERRYRRMGTAEQEALKGAAVVLGRTDWDYACMEKWGLEQKYRRNNENLRASFYAASWSFENCEKHSLFASRGDSPIKGLHRLLPAFAQVLARYPDAHLYVAGDDPTHENNPSYRVLKATSYGRYLRGMIRRLGLRGHITFLGYLNEQQMLDAYLRAHVFVLTSTIENSPNSLGEAMMLGMPCVAADVGGVTSMMTDGVEGFVCQGDSPTMLAHGIGRFFADSDLAKAMGESASKRAKATHDRDANAKALLEVYQSLSTETD